MLIVVIYALVRPSEAVVKAQNTLYFFTRLLRLFGTRLMPEKDQTNLYIFSSQLQEITMTLLLL